jgi:hypothetical protein
MFRLASVVWSYKITFKKFIMDKDSAAVYTNLRIKVPPFYLIPWNFPCVILLDFRRCPDGKVRICKQTDHHSMYVIYWLFGWPMTAVSEGLVRPLAGRVAAALGWATDYLADVWENVLQQGSALVQGDGDAHGTAHLEKRAD